MQGRSRKVRGKGGWMEGSGKRGFQLLRLIPNERIVRGLVP